MQGSLAQKVTAIAPLHYQILGDEEACPTALLLDTLAVAHGCQSVKLFQGIF